MILQVPLWQLAWRVQDSRISAAGSRTTWLPASALFRSAGLRAFQGFSWGSDGWASFLGIVLRLALGALGSGCCLHFVFVLLVRGHAGCVREREGHGLCLLVPDVCEFYFCVYGCVCVCVGGRVSVCVRMRA